jgi:hypothetical protein
MAKRRKSTAIEEAAEDLGRLLGNAQRKAESWLGQRQLVSQELSKIRDAASDLLAQLSGGGARLVRAVRRRGVIRRGAGRGGETVKRKRTMSKAARAKIAAAQRKRWAAVKKGAKKT